MPCNACVLTCVLYENVLRVENKPVVLCWVNTFRLRSRRKYILIKMVENSTYLHFEDTLINTTETLDDLNARYAKALLPLTVTFGFFTLFGVVGNSVILIVFSCSREYRRNNFKVFVLTLAVIDLITCVTLIPAEMVKQRHYFDFGDVVSCKVKCFFNVFGACASYFALLVISVDRYRKVVQPFKKQMTPSLSVKILVVVAVMLPVILAVPGTLMCGINTTNMTNIYGGQTKIHLCETEEQYETSIWRSIYKILLIVINCVISITYVILYTFVMKAAARHIRSMRLQRHNYSIDGSFMSSIYDPNVIVSTDIDCDATENGIQQQNNKQVADTNGIIPLKHLQHCIITQSRQTIDSCNDSVKSGDSKSNLSNGRFGLKSFKSYKTDFRRRGFPTKTMIWFTLTVVMIVTYLTNAILTLQVTKIVSMTAKEFSTFSFFYRIYFINHMINPLIYAIFVKTFRHSCKHIFLIFKSKITKKRL